MIAIARLRLSLACTLAKARYATGAAGGGRLHCLVFAAALRSDWATSASCVRPPRTSPRPWQAHHAGSGPRSKYALVSRRVREATHGRCRVLALSATAGKTLGHVQTVVDVLSISCVEVRGCANAPAAARDSRLQRAGQWGCIGCVRHHAVRTRAAVDPRPPLASPSLRAAPSRARAPVRLATTAQVRTEEDLEQFLHGRQVRIVPVSAAVPRGNGRGGAQCTEPQTLREALLAAAVPAAQRLHREGFLVLRSETSASHRALLQLGASEVAACGARLQQKLHEAREGRGMGQVFGGASESVLRALLAHEHALLAAVVSVADLIEPPSGPEAVSGVDTGVGRNGTELNHDEGGVGDAEGDAADVTTGYGGSDDDGVDDYDDDFDGRGAGGGGGGGDANGGGARSIGVSDGAPATHWAQRHAQVENALQAVAAAGLDGLPFDELRGMARASLRPGSNVASRPEWRKLVPKLRCLISLLQRHFREEPNSRVIAFVNRRSTVSALCETLTVAPETSHTVRAVPFVGRAQRADARGAGADGMDQGKQQQVVRDFRAGVYNVLVATCVAEEGLDIGEVDMIVCFDPVASPIRLVQRLGRTGRQKAGQVAMLLTESEQREHEETVRRSKELAAAIESEVGLVLRPSAPLLLDASPQVVYVKACQEAGGAGASRGGRESGRMGTPDGSAVRGDSGRRGPAAGGDGVVGAGGEAGAACADFHAKENATPQMAARTAGAGADGKRGRDEAASVVNLLDVDSSDSEDDAPLRQRCQPAKAGKAAEPRKESAPPHAATSAGAAADEAMPAAAADTAVAVVTADDARAKRKGSRQDAALVARVCALARLGQSLRQIDATLHKEGFTNTRGNAWPARTDGKVLTRILQGEGVEVSAPKHVRDGSTSGAATKKGRRANAAAAEGGGAPRAAMHPTDACSPQAKDEKATRDAPRAGSPLQELIDDGGLCAPITDDGAVTLHPALSAVAPSVPVPEPDEAQEMAASAAPDVVSSATVGGHQPYAWPQLVSPWSSDTWLTRAQLDACVCADYTALPPELVTRIRRSCPAWVEPKEAPMPPAPPPPAPEAARFWAL